eukprot:m.153783 g.153783  ORF g.153783 m.153783 type:complete len:519 (+) comp30850_c1_seq1:574-2130(+)
MDIPFDHHAHTQAAPPKYKVPVKAWIVSLAASLCSMSFGYDVGVISGSLTDMGNTLNLGTFEKEVVTSGLNFVAGFGALFVSGIFLDRIGRKKTIIISAVLLIVGAALAATAVDFWMLLAGRALQGLGSGCTIAATSVYITEIAPARSRGALVSLADISINFGILLGYVVDYLIRSSVVDATMSWRIALAGSAAPPFLFCFLVAWVPESPRYLVAQYKDYEALVVMETVTCCGIAHPRRAAETMLAKLINENRGEGVVQDAGWAKALWPTDAHHRHVIFIAVMIGMSQQFTGTEAILYYTPYIFGGYSDFYMFVANLGVGGMKFFGELIAAALAERAGRRRLMIAGNVMLCGAVFGIATIFHVYPAPLNTTTTAAGESPDMTHTLPAVVLLAVVMLSFSVGAGPLSLVVVNEMVPLQARAKTVAVAVFLNRMVSGTVALTFLTLQDAIGASNVFYMYGGVGVLTTVFYCLYLPNLAGLALENNTGAAEDVQPQKNDDETQRPLLPSWESAHLENQIQY